MIFGDIRVGTDAQTIEDQLKQFCEKNIPVADKWIEGHILGTKDVKGRKLDKLLRSSKKDDILNGSELSRLGRNLLMTMTRLSECLNVDVQV